MKRAEFCAFLGGEEEFMCVILDCNEAARLCVYMCVV